MPPLISCQHMRRHANDVNHVAFSTVCGFSETSSAIYLIKLRFHIVASGRTQRGCSLRLFRSISPPQVTTCADGLPNCGSTQREGLARRGWARKKFMAAAYAAGRLRSRNRKTPISKPAANACRLVGMRIGAVRTSTPLYDVAD